jgi:hypothetical protein
MDETASLPPASRLLCDPPADVVASLVRDLASLQALPASERLDALLLDQQGRWRRGDRLAVEAYQRARPDLIDDETLLHLITSEAMLRRDRGEPVDQTEYLGRFPRHADSLERQFQVEAALETVGPPGHSTHGNDESRSTVDLPSAAPPLPTDGLGVPGFEILQELGRGGMGVVYKARQIGLNRLVALKMILAGPGASESVRDRFRREAEAVAQLKHPHIVPIYAIGEYGKQLFFALEFLPGGSLAKKVGKPWKSRAAAELLATLAGAVHHAHEKGFIHRDLKPANILLDEAGKPHVTDFGLVRPSQGSAPAGMTLAGAVLGTPAYMAPEQAAGLPEATGPATDVFGLGAILYQLLTGRPPFQGADVRTTLRQAEQGRVLPVRQVNPAVPAALARICERALAADPRMRYGSAAALERDLRRYLAWGRRLAVPVTLGATVLVAGVSIALALAFGPGAQQTADREAETQPPPKAGRVEPVPPAPQSALDGELDVRVYAAGKEGVKVPEPGSLPVRKGELVHIRARLNRNAHVYLVWVDEKGLVDPLYPWDRDDPKALEEPAPILLPRREVHSPPEMNKGWPAEGEDGLETVLLLARDTPLPKEVNLGKLLGRIGPSPLRDRGEYAVRGFNRGEPVRVIADVARGAAKKAKEIDDPLLQMMERVRNHFEVIRAVRFAYQK